MRAAATRHRRDPAASSLANEPPAALFPQPRNDPTPVRTHIINAHIILDRARDWPTAANQTEQQLSQDRQSNARAYDRSAVQAMSWK